LQQAIFDFTFRTGAGHLELTIHEHFDLFDAIRRQNPDAAEAASRRMVTRTTDRAIAMLDQAETSI
jgi:GntR family galactonate operon transcriptional repressor